MQPFASRIIKKIVPAAVVVITTVVVTTVVITTVVITTLVPCQIRMRRRGVLRYGEERGASWWDEAGEEGASFLIVLRLIDDY